MAATTVFNVNNVSMPVAPPSYFLPNSTGFSVPAGFTHWELDIDTTGLTSGIEFAQLTVQYQRNSAWTDAAGVVHSAGEWLDDVSANPFTGPQGKFGTSKVIQIGSTFGSTDSNGQLLQPYPSNARIRIDSCPGWTGVNKVPNVKLTLI